MERACNAFNNTLETHYTVNDLVARDIYFNVRGVDSSFVSVIPISAVEDDRPPYVIFENSSFVQNLIPDDDVSTIKGVINLELDGNNVTFDQFHDEFTVKGLLCGRVDYDQSLIGIPYFEY